MGWASLSLQGESGVTYTVDVLVKNQTLAVRLIGAVSIQDRVAGLEEGLQKLEQTGFKRILVDLRHGSMQEAPLEAWNRHATNLTRMFCDLNSPRIAYVYDVGGGPTPAEVLAAARGYYFERFTDIDVALRWLEGEVIEHFAVPRRPPRPN
jgi:hypothetical protein